MRQRIKLKESKSKAEQLQEESIDELQRLESSGAKGRGRKEVSNARQIEINDCTRNNLVRSLKRKIDHDKKQAKRRRVDTNSECKLNNDSKEVTNAEKGCATVHGVRYATSQLNKGSAKMTRRKFNGVENLLNQGRGTGE